MKIVQIISNLGNGGAEKFTIELSNELSKNNSVSLVSFRKVNNGMIFPKLLDKNVTLIELAKKQGFSLKIYFQLLKILYREKPNVVHFHLDSTFKYVFPFVFLLQKTNFVYTIHCNIMESNRKIFAFLNKYFSFHKRVKYVCISSSIFEEFSQTFPAITFKMIENGLQIYNTKEKAENPISDKFQKSVLYNKVLIAVGRISLQKNYVLLLESISHFPNVKVNIIADLETADKEYYKKLLHIQPNNVEFIGKSDKVIELMKLSDAFIMSSSFEGLPISALEAMSVGLPILTTPCGGMVDLVENNANGFISEDFSQEKFIHTINTFLSSTQEIIEKIRKNNINTFAQHYTMKTCAEKYVQLYFNKNRR